MSLKNNTDLQRLENRALTYFRRNAAKVGELANGNIDGLPKEYKEVIECMALYILPLINKKKS